MNYSAIFEVPLSEEWEWVEQGPTEHAPEMYGKALIHPEQCGVWHWNRSYWCPLRAGHVTPHAYPKTQSHEGDG